MSRKAFTMVEMAIVLVIIGIFFGIVTKGKDLIEATNDRAELAKILRIRHVVNMATSVAIIPGKEYQYAKQYYVFNHNFLVEKGFISLDDLRASWLPSYGKKTDKCYILLQYDVKWVNDKLVTKKAHAPTDKDKYNIGLGAGDCSWYDIRFRATPPRTICLIEKILDDKNLYTGTGIAVNYTKEYHEIVYGGILEAEKCRNLDYTSDTVSHYLYGLNYN